MIGMIITTHGNNNLYEVLSEPYMESIDGATRSYPRVGARELGGYRFFRDTSI